MDFTIARELILKFDAAQEDRILSPHESWLHKQLKVVYLGFASLERTIARQRSRIAWLKDGDANTAFFHRQCSYRWQKNRIIALQHGNSLLTKQADMPEAAFAHFDDLLGTAATREHTLNLEHLIVLDANLADEIWETMKQPWFKRRRLNALWWGCAWTHRRSRRKARRRLQSKRSEGKGSGPVYPKGKKNYPRPNRPNEMGLDEQRRAAQPRPLCPRSCCCRRRRPSEMGQGGGGGQAERQPPRRSAVL
jgi:hypothetical protein